MEFNVKLQELRKQKGLTQDALAEKLFVSRAAISKWESGRGYPNLDSLKAIATFYGVTVDDLLSGEELISLAQEDKKLDRRHTRLLLFALLDISLALFFFLPVFAQRAGGLVQSVSLLALHEVSPYLHVAFYLLTCAGILCGVLTLALQKCSTFKPQYSFGASLLLGAVGVLLFVVALQPYAACYLFVFFVIKLLMLAKSR